LATCQRESVYVGLAEVAGHKFRVHCSKLKEAAYEQLFADVMKAVADLVFDYGKPTAERFERDAVPLPEVAYHALAYLRWAMLRDMNSSLGSEFNQIARDPHRRILDDPAWVPTEAVSLFDARSMQAMIMHPETLGTLRPGSSLAQTGLGSYLDGRLFPTRVFSRRRAQTHDTHENRLVKACLERAAIVVDAFRGRRDECLDPRLRADIEEMASQLELMRASGFLAEVGPLTLVPFSSSVMQRKEGYRQFLRHFVLLHMASVFGGDETWERLLELKDGARLYEIWSFFEVKRALESLIGPPRHVVLTSGDRDRRVLRRTTAHYDGDVQLQYNVAHSYPKKSYSALLRPDIAVRRKVNGQWQTLVLDAKLRFDGARFSELGDDEENESEEEDPIRSACRSDLHKMHTYRDAIRDAVGAFVLYPGNKETKRREHAEGAEYDGIGALPLVPGVPPTELKAMLTAFLQG
jgi:hypothetical protein